MALSSLFPERLSHRRVGVSELYASVLMIGVTLAVGGMVVASALGQFSLAEGSASLGASLVQSSAGVQLGLSYVAVLSSSSCPTHGGYHEGTYLTVAVYNYGSAGFTPAEFVVNSTIYQGNYATSEPGSLSAYSLSLAGCAHASGLTLVVADSSGDEVQFES